MRLCKVFFELKTNSWSYLLTLVFIIFITILSKIIHSIFDSTNIVLLYLLPVLLAAVRWGIGASVFASILGVLAFDFFFVPPFLSFSVADLRYLLSFMVFLLVALITGTLATNLRNQAEKAQRREQRTAALYALSSEIVAESELDPVLQTVVEKVATTIGGEAFFLLPDATNKLVIHATTAQSLAENFDEQEQKVADWVFTSRQVAGAGTGNLVGANYLYIPVKTEEKALGILGLKFSGINKQLSTAQKQFLEAFANLAAAAIVRLQLAAEAQRTRLLVESEKLRIALFNSISHDLRTPIASITGAVTGLLEEGELYSTEAKQALLQTIKDGGQRLNRFVENLLDMARLESGMLKLKKEWCDLQDILGVVLRQTQESWPDTKYTINIPSNLPLIKVDFSLIELVLINILENAIKYSAPSNEITITVVQKEKELQLAIADRGPGIPEADRKKIFNKFYRLYSSRNVSGTGLGLSICKGIIDLHSGSIFVNSRPEGGSVFAFSLPLQELPPGQIPSGKAGADFV
jgi:two-component system, OmpR family, sensor histidine kinase KdpD